ncbi:hypothetical protein QCB44_03740 [Thiomicrorhabdus sp. zzn3]|uniref:hypothetical protein n=1 Tax=Thiomicrorhabdus sp. zzn3 TaxID=3039775 RepID=UPI0024365E72|nr:hypothetical protein [Thiomicrorhabdus sp. zzn3]MDG6777815.1 hypothetical protein [Thiomicrorhabdus sp. zzn3]
MNAQAQTEVTLEPLSAKASLTQLHGEALHIELVNTALQYDLYNKRCRGISVSKEVNQVNRLFLQKYGLTVNNFVKQHINRNPRTHQEQLKQSLYQKLNELGGCNLAKDKGLLENFQERFQFLYDQADKSTWFPLES